MLLMLSALLLQVTTPPVGAATLARPRVDTVLVAIDDLLRDALANNLTLQSAAASLQEAQTASRSVRSRFDPLISLGGDSESDAFGGQLSGLTPTGASYLLGSVAPAVLPGQPVFPNALVASVTQPLLRGFGPLSIRPAVRAVDAGVAAARARVERTRQEVAAGIRVAYAQLVERHRQEAIATRSLRRAEDLRDAYEELRRLARITEVDVMTAQLGVTSRKASLLEAERDRRNAEDALVFAVYGRQAPARLTNAGQVLLPRDTIVVVPNLDAPDELMRDAVTRRPDVRAARLSAERAAFDVQRSRNALLPSLDVTGAFLSTLEERPNTNLQSTTESRVNGWSLGVVLTRPTRNLAVSADRARAVAVETRARAGLSEAENLVRSEVRAAVRDIRLGVEQVTLAAQASELGRRQYAGERERLTLGLSDLFRVLQYEEQVARVERAEAAAQLGLAVAVAQYRLATAAPD